MMPGNAQPFFSRSWMIALLTGLVFVGLEYGLKFEIEGADAPPLAAGSGTAAVWLPVHVLPEAHPDSRAA